MRLRNPKTVAFKPELPMPYPALSVRGVRVRPGQMSLTVAGPGAGKSQLWLNIAVRMKRPAVYWSADTDQTDATARALALLLNYDVNDVERALLDDDYRKWLFDTTGGSLNHLDFVFDSRIEPERVAERLQAFGEIHGQYPELVVLDNVSNTIENPRDEYAEIKEVMAASQRLARESDAHFALLHHAKGEYENGTTPVPLAGAVQNPFKLPELGLTLHRPADGWMAVNVVKNRSGQADPRAQDPILLPIDFSKSSVYGFLEAA